MRDSTDTAAVILYGAGAHASSVIKALHSNGLNPRCFCDRDPQKIGSIHCGLPVLSLQEAITRYPDYVLHIAVTPRYRHNIIHYLINQENILETRIAEYEEPTPTERISCEDLERNLVVEVFFDRIQIYFCCDQNHHAHRPSLTWRDESAEDIIRQIDAMRTRITADNQISGKQTECTGCRVLEKRFWAAKPKLDSFVLNGIGPCNCACLYCNCVPEIQRCMREGVKWDFKKIFTLLTLLRNKGDLYQSTTVSLAFGELTILPERNEIMEAVSDCRLSILSNGIIYNDRIASLIARPNSHLLLSLDAGTHETFQTIKRVNAFDRVVNNIARYRDNGGNVELKYIMLPENTGEKDREGFLQLALKNGISKIIVTSDSRKQRTDLGKKICDAAIALARKAREYKLEVNISGFFYPDDILAEIYSK